MPSDLSPYPAVALFLPTASGSLLPVLWLPYLLPKDALQWCPAEASPDRLEEKEPLPDKEVEQMAWVRAANQHRAIAEEIILKELIYV